MTPERWAQIEDLFHRAAECDANRRTALLDEACNGDLELRREVEALLCSEASARDHVHAAVHSELHDFAFSLIGEVVSHYRILDAIGGGGMGLVYRAEDIRLGRQVALKFLPEESAKDPAALARFEREARTASALEHPNICPIYEFGEHEGRPFLVMQLLEGQSLRELLKTESESSKPGSRVPSLSRRPLPLDQALDLGIQIANGLEAAHQKGIVHRDIKPANIFVTSLGQARILDFGLAKLALGAKDEAEGLGHEGSSSSTKPSVGEAERPTTPDPFLSRTGVAMGTAGYMSPEQARGEKLDARTDVFSFGLVLYEMATGRRAFEGDTGPALRSAILTQLPLPARKLNPQVPTKLDAIIHRALQKSLEARYQSVAQMRADLGRLRREMESKRFKRWTLGLGVAAAVLIAAAILWFARRPVSSAHGLPDLKLQQLTVNSPENLVTGGAISPDGKFLAYTDQKGMHIKGIGTDEAQSVPQPEELRNNKVSWEILPTAWFLDSKRFFANSHPASENPSAWSSQTSSIWLVSVSGGVPRRLHDNAVGWSTSPDGSSISFGTSFGKLGDHELWLMAPDGGWSRKLYESDENHAACCLYFFPDGRQVAYISTDQSGDSLVSRDLRGGPLTTLLPPSELKKMGDSVWLPKGQLIYSEPCNWALMRPDSPCNYWMERFDTRTGQLIEKPRRVTNWTGFWMNDPSATADGKRIAFLESSGRGVGYLADLDARGTRLINSRRFTLEEGGDDVITDWTADSRTVILGLNRGDHYSLRKQALNSDVQLPIVTSAEGGLLTEAFVSPDGKWVIAQIWPITGGPTVKLIRVPISGGTPELIFTVREGSTFFCARPPSKLCAVAEQSEDRKQMIITAFDPIKGRGSELARFELDPNFDTNVSGLLCNISPDGTHLAAARGPGGPIRIRSLRDRATQVIRAKDLNRIRLLGWAADGKGLFVSNTTNDGGEVLHLDLQGNAKPLWKCNTDRCFGLPSPDGRHLAIYDWKLSANMWMMENF